jgi:hypothetical protein
VVWEIAVLTEPIGIEYDRPLTRAGAASAARSRRTRRPHELGH